MLSKREMLKKTIRRFLPASDTTVNWPVPTHLNPVSSGPIGGGVDATISAIETSLAALKETSSLMAKVPWISPVAGLILQALTMREDVRQYKEEWGAVMDKVESIAGLVNSVGTSCARYNLDEKDLPRGLRDIFLSLETELGGIERALEQSKEVGSIKKILLRKDLLRQVKQYDAKLSHVLQRFQATLIVDIRFAQVAEGLKIAQSGRRIPPVHLILSYQCLRSRVHLNILWT
ncbi:hypothetical protein BC826DRAFT_601651 [Russula brevipes]|nr:hypothetical protein BC826DRAFT_601651 [Russula brevipes]